MAEQLALDGFDGKVMHPRLVMTAYHGTNDALIASAARLYIPDRAVVLDCTYSAGRFWRQTDTSRFRLVGSDIRPVAGIQADMRRLPYRDHIADVVVIDPPYVHDVGVRTVDTAYANRQTTPGFGYDDIIALYRDGMAEATRVLRPGGLCWVKCQDQVQDHRQRWAVVDLHAAAAGLGYEAQDMFILTVAAPPGAARSERQFHARRNHSYLWVFRAMPP